MEQLTRELMTRSFLYDDTRADEAGVRAAPAAGRGEPRGGGATQSPAA
jgi:hypothetical protein